jgi:hypothetical protein
VQVVAAVSSVVVGAVFVAAGVLKLLGRHGWMQQAADLHVPRHIAAVVPYIELTLGVVSIVAVWLPWSAYAAIILLILFSALIARRLLDGSRPPCACFGARSSRRLGLVDLGRNFGLLALASLAAIWS